MTRPQARPIYQLRDLKPTKLRRWRIDWWRDLGNLLGGVVLVLAAVELWGFVRWH